MSSLAVFSLGSDLCIIFLDQSVDMSLHGINEPKPDPLLYWWAEIEQLCLRWLG